MLCFKLSVMIGFLFFVVMGCSPSVNDGFERTKRMELNQGTKSRFNEIQSIGKSVHKFLKAELDNEKIENIFDQLIDAVVLLENYVEGKDRRGGYRPGDLRWFLQTQVLKSRAGKSKLVFRDQLAVEFFNLKASLLGGERDFIAKKEMRNIVDFLKMLKSQALKLNPYMKFYNWKNTEDLFKSNEEVYKELMLAQNQLRSSAKILSEFIYQRRGAKYFFKSFEVLFKEIRIMIGWSSSDVSRSVEEYRALFSTLKQLAVAGDTLSVESREWPVYIKR